jgi:hypothetical protein
MIRENPKWRLRFLAEVNESPGIVPVAKIRTPSSYAEFRRALDIIHGNSGYVISAKENDEYFSITAPIPPSRVYSFLKEASKNELDAYLIRREPEYKGNLNG